MSASDAASFRTSVDAYELHVGRYGRSLSSAFLDFVDPPRSVRILEVGCGPGALTSALADRLGPDQVAAVDPSDSFAEACRSRLPGVDVRVAGAERLPFEDGGFDGVLSQLVINFLEDAEVGVAEMIRVSGPGATVAACVWDYTAAMTMLRAFWDAAIATDPAAEELDEGRRMPYCNPDDLAALWRGAGLEEVATVPLVARAAYRDFEDFWSPFPLGVAPSGAYCASLPAAGQARLKRACYERLGSPEGPFELDARAWAVSGTLGRP
jgi:SAM-dependent methyltransferase